MEMQRNYLLRSLTDIHLDLLSENPSQEFSTNCDIVLYFEDSGRKLYSKLLVKLFLPFVNAHLDFVKEEDQSECVTMIFADTLLRDHLNLNQFNEFEASGIDIHKIAEDSSEDQLPKIQSKDSLIVKEIPRLLEVNIKHHFIKTKEISKYACSHCGKSFDQRFKLTRHLVSHDQASFFCNNCPQKFKRKQHLLDHYKQYHAENTESFVCNICSERFKSNSNLKRHIMIHNTEGRPEFSCSRCQKIFHYKQNHIRHMKTCKILA